MLAGHLSNQDEDEVEEELAALQQGPLLPNAPTAELPEGAAADEAEEEAAEQGAKTKTKTRAIVTAS